MKIAADVVGVPAANMQGGEKRDPNGALGPTRPTTSTAAARLSLIRNPPSDIAATRQRGNAAISGQPSARGRRVCLAW